VRWVGSRGGLPSQPFSKGGGLGGISGGRSGLIKEVFRLMRGQRVPWVLIENVPFMLRLGGGAALELIISNLEEFGYRWAYRVVNTHAFGLPQRRERVFVLASRRANPADVLLADEVEMPEPQSRSTLSELAHGFYWTEGNRGLGWAVDAIPTLKGGSAIGIPAPPAILMPDGRIINPDIRDAERLNGFDADWTAPAETAKRRSFRWSLVGNAVSVPVSAWIGHRLKNPGRYDRSRDKGPIAGRGWPKAARSWRGQRVEVKISTAPVLVATPHLHDFLRYPGAPLSARATAGFYLRACRSSLRFTDGFLEAVAAHLEQVRGSELGTGRPNR
jgi:DNA (cytosine-5)-methyltransferase 1